MGLLFDYCGDRFYRCYIASLHPTRSITVVLPCIPAMLTWLEYIIQITFAVDIILNFITGVRTGDSLDVDYQLPVIARTYLRTWFPIDFLGTFPFDMCV